MKTTNKGLEALTPQSVELMGLAERAVENGAYPDALNIYDLIIASEPIGYVYAKRGFVKFQSGDHIGAIADFDRAILLKPDSPATLRFRARSKEFLDDLDGAVSDYRASLSYEVSSETHCDIAMIFEYQGHTQKAVAEFQLALEIDSENELARNSLERLATKSM